MGFAVGGFRGAVVNRADARGGIWDVEVVEEIIGRPLHHTLLLLNRNKQFQASSSAPPIAYRLSPIASRLSPIAYRLSPIA